MGASVQDMFAFVAQFGPMLGELAARQAMLEERVERLEAGGVRAVAPAGAGDDGPDVDAGGEIEMPGGGKVGMADLFKQYMPTGGPSALFSEALKRGMKTPATTPAAAPAAQPPPQPEVK